MAKAAAEHLAYIERDGAEKDGSPSVLFGRDGPVPRAQFEEPRLDEQHQFRFVVSPDDGHELDLHDYVLRLMARVERELGPLEWTACNHYDTDNPHVHVVVRGVDLHGRRVLMSRQYISRGMRWTAQELATELLGPRLESEIRRTREREVTQERLTSLDRELERCATDHRVEVASVHQRARDDTEAQHLVDRLEHLGRLGFAQQVSSAWQLTQGWDKRLRELGERGDIIKQIHRAMRGGTSDRFMPSGLARACQWHARPSNCQHRRHTVNCDGSIGAFFVAVSHCPYWHVACVIVGGVHAPIYAQVCHEIDACRSGLGRVGVLIIAAALGFDVGCGRSELGDDFALYRDGGGSMNGQSADNGPTDGSGAIDGGGRPVEGGPASDSTSGENNSMEVGPTVYYPDGGCGPTTCATGCCREDGLCVSRQSDAFCGVGGRRCFSCEPNKCETFASAESSDGAVAPVGVSECLRLQPNCGPSNCEGCCALIPYVPQDTCVVITSDLACGYAGGNCGACQSNQRCRPLPSGGGFCQAKDTCGPGNCDGCCLGNVCAAGDQNIACGYAGSPCETCADGGACAAHVCDYSGEPLFVPFVPPPLPSD